MVYVRCLIRFLCAVVCVLIITNCTHIKSISHEYTVEVSEPKRIRFQGKGMGAGMMLAGTMGPMGMAIGVAIDEGISKDIQLVADKVNFDFEKTARTFFDSKGGQFFLEKLASRFNNTGTETLKIQFKRYGFKT